VNRELGNYNLSDLREQVYRLLRVLSTTSYDSF